MAASQSQLVSLLQNTLGTLIGKQSMYIESLSEPVKKRIKALKYYQQEHAKLEAKAQQEILAIEKKYSELYKPLYEIRSKIIRGESEKETKEKGTEEEDAEHKDTEEKSTKEMDIETDTQEKGAEKDKEACNPVKGIPEFWLTAMKNVENIDSLITERDQEALKYLVDIRMSHLEEKPGFKLEFEFDEKNPYFTNKILSKTYYYQEKLGYGGDYVYDHAEGEAIDTNKSRIVKTTIPVESFFKFFSPPKIDYHLGEELKDKLIPHAVDWYTGSWKEWESR
ncbi:12461_t:CDS:2 [Entrophospora sp. SA101]|nr:11235_t:CDS:2 [Entrophospora sp. SA101]CAJ0842743.1 12461_t:CDS:2 [Entrophospora sp. SA101]